MAISGGISKREKRGTTERRRGKNRIYLEIAYYSKEIEELMKQKIESAKNDKEMETLKDF
ncbi:MAG: hypothetical protein KAH35_07610 [Candidatus Atribacteria bacterium]|nr:hypothetical protein [Candidatus Atribacteria bacterium]